jgi:hypothetical protein
LNGNQRLQWRANERITMLNFAGLPSRLALGAFLALGLALAGSAWTFAHEVRPVGNGNYSMTVGFLNEPTYLGLENGLYVNIVQIGGANEPVEDLQETLQAEVIFGASTMPLTLVPLDGSPGSYVGRFIPTRTGDYTFHVSGTIADQTVDEEFRSSPSTFDSVQPADAAQFPDPVPAGSDLANALSDAEDDAASARTLATIGIGVGAFGLLIALFVLGMSLRRKPA